jgi:hypothetical protein
MNNFKIVRRGEGLKRNFLQSQNLEICPQKVNCENFPLCNTFPHFKHKIIFKILLIICLMCKTHYASSAKIYRYFLLALCDMIFKCSKISRLQKF